MDFKEEAKTLIDIIQKSKKPDGKRWRKEDIANEVGYTREHLQRLLSEKGLVDENLIILLKSKFKSLLENITPGRVGEPDLVLRSGEMVLIIELKHVRLRDKQNREVNLSDVLEKFLVADILPKELVQLSSDDSAEGKEILYTPKSKRNKGSKPAEGS